MALPRSLLRRAARRPRSRGFTPTGPTAGNAPEPSSRPMASGSRSCAGPATARPAPCTIRNARSGRSPLEASLSCPSAGSSSEHTPGTSAGVAWSCTTTARHQPLLPGSGSLRRVSCSAGSLSTVDFVYTLLERLTKPCHRPVHIMRLMSHGAKQEQGNQRGALQEASTVTADCETVRQGRTASPERRAGAQRHPVRAANGYSLGGVTARTWFWQRHDLLAAAARLAGSRCMARVAPEVAR